MIIWNVEYSRIPATIERMLTTKKNEKMREFKHGQHKKCMMLVRYTERYGYI